MASEALSTWVPRHNSSPNSGDAGERAKRLDLRTGAEAAHPERKYSTAGVNLAIIERRTHEHRQEIARKHLRRAADAAAAAERAYPYCGHHSTLGAPLLGPWWDSGGRPEQWTDKQALKLTGSVRRVRRRKGERPRAELVPARLAHDSTARWHRSRARGQDRRCLTVGHCGDGEVQATCACGHTATAPIRCGCIRLCFRCMAKRAHKQRARFMRAYRVVLREGLQAGRYRKTAPGGRWTDKHLVLTVPHLVVKDAAGIVDRAATARRRIEVLLHAWDDFARSLQRWLRRHKQHGARFYRCFEWTLGKDGMGHPHMHVWLHGPWLPEHDSHRVSGWYQPCGRAKGERCVHCEVRAGARRVRSANDGGGAAPVSGTVQRGGARPLPGGAAGGPVLARVAKGHPGKRVRGVRSWWAVALGKQGVAIDAAAVNITLRAIRFRCIEFVREVKKPSGVTYTQRSIRVAAESGGADPVAALVRYFEPWSIASSDPETGEQVSEDVLAAVYCALEGKRMSQGSRGFLGLGDVIDPVCQGCGYCAAKRVDVRPWDRQESGDDYRRPEAARGPPSTAPEHSAAMVSTERIVDPHAFTALLEQAAEDLRTRGWRKLRDPWHEARRP